MTLTKKTLLTAIISSCLVFPLTSAQAVTLVPRKLDGKWTPLGSENKWPIAVMIDNHTAARPQSGLQSASVVYEALAEGGIPRFMAIFADTNVKEIGPVRSTRPYFVRFASEISAAMVHAGGSPDGLALLKKLRFQGIEGIKGVFAKYFYRAHSGDIHGLYTSGPKLLAALIQAKTTKLTPRYHSWLFGDAAPMNQRPNGKHGVTIDFGYGKAYDVEFRYDKKTNEYLRFTGGRVHKDRLTNKQISVRNVVIMNVPKEKVLDRKGRLDINVIGKGTGFLLKNGVALPIKWSKKSDGGRTIFTDLKNQEVTFIRGNVWVEVVPKGHAYKAY